jgi:hypothetical protein
MLTVAPLPFREMLTCHERYKIALFCGLSPPLDKSRTVVTVHDSIPSLWGCCAVSNLRRAGCGARGFLE